MKNITIWTKRLGGIAMGMGLMLTAVSGPATADDPRKSYNRGDPWNYRHDRGIPDERMAWDKDRRAGYERGVRDRRTGPLPRYSERSRGQRTAPVVVHRGKKHIVPRDRIRWYRNVVIVRPYGHWYPGYAHYYHDDDAYKWLAFTAITLGVLDYLNEVQQREHEAAQIAATSAPIGERIIWNEGNASGYVVATREGTSTAGRYCREFQHEINVGGKQEQGYGTACRQPDGSWEVISTGQ